ncbi:MAG TPA: DUF1579 domain-containing protein [Melioribacteraceae bacterium]|nr:DUF1579 domain-containing protein [Melioribacteraceae bacterium]
MKYFIIFVLFVASLSFGQENISPEQAQKLWMEYMTPGDVHASFAKSVGNWDTEAKSWMDPSGEPVVSKGTAVIEMLLGGRYMQSKYFGTVMGMPFEGMGIDAYDNSTKEYKAIWIDNLGTGIIYMLGKHDPSKNQIEYKGKMVDPVIKGETNIRQVITFIDENTQQIEMYGEMMGKEFKSMEMIMKKVKK